MTTYSNPEADSRLNAYKAAAKISKSRMAQEAPLDAAALEAIWSCPSNPPELW